MSQLDLPPLPSPLIETICNWDIFVMITVDLTWALLLVNCTEHNRQLLSTNNEWNIVIQKIIKLWNILHSTGSLFSGVPLTITKTIISQRTTSLESILQKWVCLIPASVWLVGRHTNMTTATVANEKAKIYSIGPMRGLERVVITQLEDTDIM